MINGVKNPPFEEGVRASRDLAALGAKRRSQRLVERGAAGISDQQNERIARGPVIGLDFPQDFDPLGIGTLAS